VDQGVFKKFMEVCPNHPFPFNEGMMRTYLRYIGFATLQTEERARGYSPPTPVELLLAYELVKASRRPRRLEDLPKAIIKVLEDIAKKVDRLVVCGSYASGAWIDNDTPDFFVDLKKRVKGKNKTSDLDLIVYPEIELKYHIAIDLCSSSEKDQLIIK